MIILENVSKTYAKGAVKAVDGLSLHIRPGELFGFIGPNGAGKTTTIGIITGIIRPDSGNVVVGGIDMYRDMVGAKMKIGYVPDSPNIYEKLSGMEYLNFIADIYGIDTAERKKCIPELLEMFELSDAAGSQIKSYSKGMKQKIVVISALMHRPPLWILDEPMVGLDPRSAHQMKELMRKHCDEGNTVFFSTHVLEVAEKLCDNIGIIKQGRLIAEGSLDELRSGQQGQSLENIFLELTEPGGN